MKIRIDYVTNSSSSSFMILKQHLTENQIKAIREHKTLGEKLGMSYTDWDWFVSENKLMIGADTSMDNFDMDEFLKTIGVNDNYINWGASVNCSDDDLEIENCENKKTNWEDLLNEI